MINTNLDATREYAIVSPPGKKNGEGQPPPSPALTEAVTIRSLKRQPRLGGLSHKMKGVNRSDYTNKHLDVSKNRGTPKSSISIGFSIINHPF